MIELWFYKGKGNRYDKLIRWWNRSRFSHVELHVDGICYSSSPRDGGVRSKEIEFSDNWTRVPILWANHRVKQHAMNFFSGTMALPYDRRGIVWSQIFAASYHKENAYFCSEWCAKALMLKPTLINPEQLYQMVSAFNVLTTVSKQGDN